VQIYSAFLQLGSNSCAAIAKGVGRKKSKEATEKLRPRNSYELGAHWTNTQGLPQRNAASLPCKNEDLFLEKHTFSGKCLPFNKISSHFRVYSGPHLVSITSAS